MALSLKHLLISGALLVACSTQDTEPGVGLLDAAAEARVTLPEAETSPGPDTTNGSDDAYPIDPDGPPPDCILPCVWEAMKRCPGPAPGQVCVEDRLSIPGARVSCCAMDPPAPGDLVACEDEAWVQYGSIDKRAYKNGEPCWTYRGEATALAPGPPPRAAGWTTTWSVPDEATGGEIRIATLEHRGPMFPGNFAGKGTCYDGDDVAFTVDVDVTVEHCRKWYPRCDVPGICTLPPELVELRDPPDAAPSVDAAATSDTATSSDASTGLDAAQDE